MEEEMKDEGVDALIKTKETIAISWCVVTRPTKKDLRNI
jgi:hypothetical protein